MQKLDWIDWLRKTQKRQDDRAVAALLKQQAEDTRPLHEKLQSELDSDNMPECQFILMSKAMIAEAIMALRA